MTREEAIKRFETLLLHVDTDCVMGMETTEAINMAIKALEQPEPCEDAVSREDAISALDDEIIITGKSNAYVVKDYVQRVMRRLENLPSVTLKQRWIPCSERLPEEKEKSYWVCCETGGQCQCRWTNDMYGLGANKWSKWGWHIMDKPQYSKIVAWMPLPEAYREEGGE